AGFRVTEKWVVTMGMEECLFLFPETEWEIITKKIKALPLTKKDARGFLRVLLAGASYLSCDRQGRILLPENLSKYAKLSDRCTVIGMLNRLEIWEPGRWEKYSKGSEGKFSDLAESIGDLDL
ncbi:MAG: division/cell wall cluster transcriptional repressor MraZ, partial [Elusimicrobiota bacterium]|nr:division/cell wall cluster transcriptional repressor MraZ [Elusimicrobiota bacterium]